MAGRVWKACFRAGGKPSPQSRAVGSLPRFWPPPGEPGVTPSATLPRSALSRAPWYQGSQNRVPPNSSLVTICSMGPLQCLGAHPLFSPPPAEPARPFVHFAPRHSHTCTCGPSVLKLQHFLLSPHQSYFSASRVRKIQPAAPDSTPESWSLGWYLLSALRQARSSLPLFPSPRQAKKGWLPRHGTNFLGPPDHNISEQLAARVPHTILTLKSQIARTHSWSDPAVLLYLISEWQQLLPCQMDSNLSQPL